MITKPSFESSAHGRIEQVLLTIPSWVLRYQHQVEIRSTAAVYQDVLQSLRSHTRFIIVTHQESERPLHEWLDSLGTQDRTEVIVVPNQTKLSVWTEDAFTICTDASGRRWILQPRSREHPDEGLVSKLIAERAGWQYVETHHRFESGNMLVGDDFWFLGVDSAWDSLMKESPTGCNDESVDGRPQRGSHEVVDGSRQLYIVASQVRVPGFEEKAQVRETVVDGVDWHEVVYRGNRKNTGQPIFHIDAFITLAGRGEDGQYNVLVGDPAMAATALSTRLPDHSMQFAFDDIAGQLGKAGFNVVRNPLPLVYHDNHMMKTRHWYFATANNALVEIDGCDKNVWLPTYGDGSSRALEKTDRLNEEIWQRLGFKTYLLGDNNPFAVNLGAIRCLAKCILRGRTSDDSRR